MKHDGSMQVCGDYKVTLNPFLEINQHPLPRIEECFQTMNGGQKFTKLTLKELTIINTHRELY